jgi:hypothetical protein
MKCDTEFDLFFQMNSKVEKLKLENEKKDLEIEQIEIHYSSNGKHQPRNPS